MTLNSSVSAAPEIAKALLLYPDEPGGDYGGDYHWVNTTGERLPLCGGGWYNGSGAGVFGVGPVSYTHLFPTSFMSRWQMLICQVLTLLW